MDAIHDFARDLEAGGTSEARRRDHLRALRQISDHLAPDPLLAASADDLLGYLAQRRDAGYAPGTLRKERQMALSFFTWANQAGHIDADALISLRSIASPWGTSDRVHPKPYSPKDLRAFRETIVSRWPRMDDARAGKFAQRWRDGDSPYSRIRKHAIRLQLDAVIALALHCGLRRSEIGTLHLDDMHYDNGYVVVWGGERWNSHSREVPFTEHARSAVKAWLDFRARMGVLHDSPWLNLWAARTAREPIKPHAFAKLLASYAAPELSYRRLRHTCGIAWLKAGMTLWEVQRLLGHSSLKDTLPFGEAIKADLQRRTERRERKFSESVTLAA